MRASLEQLSQIIVFAGLETAEKISLQPYTQVQSDRKGEIILHEGDVLPAITGKETILQSGNWKTYLNTVRLRKQTR